MRVKQPGEVVSFKVAAWCADAHAWCDENGCDWSHEAEASADDRNAVSRVTRAARRHTEQTGHETRIDVTHQRGYRRRELVEADFEEV